MYPEALAALRCPHPPHTALELAAGARYAPDGAVLEGILRAVDGTPRHYPIRDGIIDLLDGARLPRTPAQITNYLPLTAWAYERLWRGRALTLLSGEAFGYDRELPLLRHLMQPERGGVYLDVACSNGLYARALAAATHADLLAATPPPATIIGIDHSLPMLQQARAYALQHRLRITYVRASAQALPIAGAAVAGIAMGGSLNEIGDRRAFFAEARRVLEPHGRLVLMHLVQASESIGQAVQAILGTGGIDFPPLATIHAELGQAQFHPLDETQYGVVVFSAWQPA